MKADISPAVGWGVGRKVLCKFFDENKSPTHPLRGSVGLSALAARNAALDAQIRAQGYTPLPPKVVVPTRPPKP